MGGWVGEERLVGRRPGQRVLSENNNTPDLGAYTFKAGPAPPAPSRPPAEVSALVALGSGELDSLSPQALREEREAEDSAPSGLAGRVCSEVSAAGGGGGSAGCSR